MDNPVLIFILLFVLVLILILLHHSNKKYADKISVLEQTLDMKVESITSLKSTYAEARNAIDKYIAQQSTVALQEQSISTLSAHKESLEKRIQDVATQMKEEQALHVNTLKEHTKVIDAMHQESRQNERKTEILKRKYEEALHLEKSKQQTLQTNLEIKTNKISELTTHLTQNISHAKELKEQLETTISANQSEIENLKKQYQKSQEYIKENSENNRAKLKDKDIEIEELQRKVTIVENLKKKHTKSVEGYTKNINQLEKDIVNQEKQLEALEARYKNEINIYLESINKDEQTIQDLQNEQKIFLETIIKLEETVDEKKKMHKDSIQSYHQLEQKSQEEKKAVEARIKEIENEKYTLERELSAMTISYEKEKDALLFARRERRDLEEIYQEYKGLAKERFKDYEKEIEKQNSTHSEQQKFIGILKEEIVQKEKSYFILSNKYKDSSALFKKEKMELGQQIERDKKELTHLENLLDKANVIHKNERKELSNKMVSYIQRIDRLEEQKREKQRIIIEKNKAFEVMLQRKENDIQQFKVLQKERDNSIFALEINIKQKEKEIETFITNRQRIEVENEKKLMALNHQIKAIQNEQEEEKLLYALKLEEEKKLYNNLEERYKKKEKEIKNLYQNYQARKDEMENQIKVLNSIIIEKEKDIISIKRNSLHKNFIQKENVEKVQTEVEESHDTIQAKVIHAIDAGEDKKMIAKRFNIPMKRVELIMKFNQIQQKG